MSVIRVVKPATGSLICTFRTSPELKVSVWPFGVNVWIFVFCGLGGPAGTPLRWRKAKLTGSGQFGFRPTKLNFDARLSMFIAEHHLVRRQLGPSTNGVIPGA